MKQLVKKTLSLGIVSILSIGIISGCKSEQTVDNQGELPTLTIYMSGKEHEDLAMVMEKANEIAADKIGAKIDLNFLSGYTDKMNMKMASGEEFDICFVGYNNSYQKAIQNGALTPLKELIDEYANELWEEIPEYYWNSVEFGGEYYAVPNQQIAALPTSITMETKYAEQYGISEETVKHINDLEPYLAKMKADYPQKYAYRPNNGTAAWTNQSYETISTMLGIKRGEENPKVMPIYETEEFEDAVKTMSDWFKKGYIRADVASVMDDNTDFRGGKYIVTGTTYKPGFEQNQAAQLGGEHMAVTLETPYMNTSNCTSTMYGISTTSKHPVEAIKFIKEMNTNTELYNLICYGIEGEHYTKVDDTHVAPIKDGGYYPNASWAFGNQFNAYLLDGQADDLWEQTKKVNDEAERSVVLGFVFDTENVVTEISQCATVISEFSGLTNGSANWETDLPEFKNRMKASGIEKIQAEMQSQIDEFLKNK